MRGFIAFTNKELLEGLRTYRCLILFAVFFLFGMMSPLLAKLMPEILAGIEMQGMQLILPEPTVMDAYSQFFKNLTQMGILVLLLVFGGMLSGELSRGTLVTVLAKGLPRHTVLLSKFTAAVVLWTFAFGMSAVVNYGYTEYLFAETSVSNLFFSAFCLWLFGCLILVLILLSSTIASGNFGGLVLSACSIVLMLIINAVPNMERYNPITLASRNMAILSGETSVDELMTCVLITCGLILGSILLSIALFRRKKL